MLVVYNGPLNLKIYYQKYCFIDAFMHFYGSLPLFTFVHFF